MAMTSGVGAAIELRIFEMDADNKVGKRQLESSVCEGDLLDV